MHKLAQTYVTGLDRKGVGFSVVTCKLLADMQRTGLLTVEYDKGLSTEKVQEDKIFSQTKYFSTQEMESFTLH